MCDLCHGTFLMVDEVYPLTSDGEVNSVEEIVQIPCPVCVPAIGSTGMVKIEVYDQSAPRLPSMQGMSLAAYFDLCEAHDWFYAFSDDPGVYRAGDAESVRLIEGAKSDPAKCLILEAWKAHVYSGDGWGRAKQPLPKRSDFGIAETANMQ